MKTGGARRGARNHARVTAEVDEVVDIGDPYDGYNRCLPAAPFLGPLLANSACTSSRMASTRSAPSTGSRAPRAGSAGVPVNLSPADAAARLADPAIGWTYIDQAQSNPAMHNLTPLRAQIISARC